MIPLNTSLSRREFARHCENMRAAGVITEDHCRSFIEGATMSEIAVVLLKPHRSILGLFEVCYLE